MKWHTTVSSLACYVAHVEKNAALAKRLGAFLGKTVSEWTRRSLRLRRRNDCEPGRLVVGRAGERGACNTHC